MKQVQGQQAQGKQAQGKQNKSGQAKQTQGKQTQGKQGKQGNKVPPVSVIPLGGMGEIGKNMWLFESNGDILVVDTGVMFPEDEMLGVDLVIPDLTYLKENKDRVKGIVLTHGHEDHVGALPYVLRDINVPVYGTRLTLGLVKNKLQEHGLVDRTELREVKAGQHLEIGDFALDLVHVNHSIADVLALAITTPAGLMIFATDFKIDYTPIDGKVTDLHRLTELGRKGVLALFSDSTNAERPGYTHSEREVGETFSRAFAEATGRILVASFASNVHRIQQVFDAAAAYKRKVCVTGRSMINVVRIASELGYLNIPKGTLMELDQLDKHPANRVVVLTTGSQGEPLSALTRMAMGEHRQVEIVPGDTVIISASAIPGNERLVGRNINHLFKLGANVIYEAVSGVHVSGHASQEELKLMLSLTRPKYFVPIHGEYRMLVRHAELAKEVGIPEDNIFILENGARLEFTPGGARKAAPVPSGQILVDGLGVGDVGNIVLRDRKQLSEDGILIAVVTIDKQSGKIVAGPDLISRGFVYIRESEALLDEARSRVGSALNVSASNGVTDWSTLKGRMKEVLSGFLYERTKRRPVILPIVMES